MDHTHPAVVPLKAVRVLAENSWCDSLFHSMWASLQAFSCRVFKTVWLVLIGWVVQPSIINLGQFSSALIYPIYLENDLKDYFSSPLHTHTHTLPRRLALSGYVDSVIVEMRLFWVVLAQSVLITQSNVISCWIFEQVISVHLISLSPSLCFEGGGSLNWLTNISKRKDWWRLLGWLDGCNNVCVHFLYSGRDFPHYRGFYVFYVMCVFIPWTLFLTAAVLFGSVPPFCC